jgi:hypothetical protein
MHIYTKGWGNHASDPLDPRLSAVSVNVERFEERVHLTNPLH